MRLRRPALTLALVPLLLSAAPATGASAAAPTAWAGDSEGGRTLLGLGVRARLPFRVLALDGPGSRSRLVVDVAHQW